MGVFAPKPSQEGKDETAWSHIWKPDCKKELEQERLAPLVLSLSFFWDWAASSAITDLIGAHEDAFVSGYEPIDRWRQLAPEDILGFTRATFDLPTSLRQYGGWLGEIRRSPAAHVTTYTALRSRACVLDARASGFKVRPYTLPESVRPAFRQLLHKHDVRIINVFRRNKIKAALSLYRRKYEHTWQYGKAFRPHSELGEEGGGAGAAIAARELTTVNARDFNEILRSDWNIQYQVRVRL
eukprot:jgi/Mesvir1/12798/Mv22848-RA.1